MIAPFDILYYRTKRMLEAWKWYRKWRGGKWSKWWIDSPCGFDVWEHSWKRPGLGVSLEAYESYPPLNQHFCEVCQRIVLQEPIALATDFGVQACNTCIYDTTALERKQW